MPANPAGAVGIVAALVVVAAALGLIGVRGRPMRSFLVVIGPLYSLAIFAYFFIEGAGSQCAGAGTTFHCWEITYASTWGMHGSVVVGIAMILSLTPIAAAWTRRRAPTVVAAVALPLMIGIHVPGLIPWVPSAAAVLAAAIAGPPSRVRDRKEVEATPAR
jgi:hypothetical protein